VEFAARIIASLTLFLACLLFSLALMRARNNGFAPSDKRLLAQTGCLVVAASLMRLSLHLTLDGAVLASSVAFTLFLLLAATNTLLIPRRPFHR
jgi:hypothetical protein